MAQVTGSAVDRQPILTDNASLSSTTDRSSLEELEQIARDVAEMVRAMPDEEARTVRESAASVTARLAKEEEEWGRLCEKAAKSPEFAAFAAEIEKDSSEGKVEPLDLDRL